MKPRLVIGSRGSKLALVQAELIKGMLERLNPDLELRIEIIKTTGDVKTEPLTVIGGKGVFTKELEEALLDGRIDIAVHSLKDLPTIIPDSLALTAICEREDARDALILRKDVARVFPSLGTLREGTVVGTSSRRRLAQLKHLVPNLTIRDVRGNIDTRLRKLDEGQYDALILAAAGLRRLGLGDRITSTFRPSEMLPAPGQGALGIETRADDSITNDLVSQLDHDETRVACTAERAFLRTLGGGCQLPIAAYATVHESHLRIEGLVADETGDERIIKGSLSGSVSNPGALGVQLADRLLNEGAARLLSTAETRSLVTGSSSED
jgi:hydroxymethylbilane synthase